MGSIIGVLPDTAVDDVTGARLEADERFLQGVKTLGFPNPRGFAHIIRILLCGSQAGALGRTANRSAEENMQHLQELGADLDKDLVLLVNVLVFGGGLAMELDKAASALWAKCGEGERAPLTAASVWRHW